VSELEEQLKRLMLAGLAGDAAAVREFLTLLGDRFRAYFSRRLGSGAAETEDLVQEALLAVFTRRGTWDSSQPVSAWVFAIARYKLIDHYRRGRVRRHVPLEDVEAFLAQEAPDPDAGVEVERALASLPARHAALVRDVKLDGLSLAEAGERAGITPGAAKVSLHRALKALKAKVGLG
jgi:RNA polymerase sigma-70 factor (ECF subfamily)